MIMKNKQIKNTVLSAVFLSLGIVLPLFTGQIKEIGDSLLPMHLTVMLCGFFCGPVYAGAVGFLTPVLKSVLTSMPPIYPNAIWMSAELLTYGICVGLFYKIFKKNGVLGIYLSLIPSMLIGRIVWGVCKAILLGSAGKTFTIAMFISGGFTDAFLGIAIQLLLIPIIVNIFKKEKL